MLNPDVAAAGVDPAEHYSNFGIHEGRSYVTTYAQDGLFTIHNSDFRQDPAFDRAYSRGLKANQGLDFKWHWRVHVGLWAARTAARLPGDFVECGVNRGFLASAIMEDLDWNRQGRKFWLLDTFGGIDFEGVSAEEGDFARRDRNERLLKSGLYTSEAESVRENFAEWQNVEIVVGAVPGTLDQITSDQIAFASIDMNTAAPEIAAMKFLWPRLVPGAMIVLDDYAYHGYLPQKHAMDAFAREYGTSVLSLPTGQGLIIRPPDA
ncbi:TylF/MycF/NovP-related O-methyltransferase [Aliiruegeria sabulilitoris]|uniref:TylF/MycF/NovP-related O-methyltransferase n=1 Tax=Aliiruegeria sabulilitoris TaxID=1510458 RepID=UPI0009EB5900|nr:TylF/MycF/NovP-related O-methyltransferase [Aliiruegeria sabulilitoris]NDR59708.1 class I SAM-dependent methyltransferase [Pseudoruegeria sp. M32A2M]